MVARGGGILSYIDRKAKKPVSLVVLRIWHILHTLTMPCFGSVDDLQLARWIALAEAGAAVSITSAGTIFFLVADQVEANVPLGCAAAGALVAVDALILYRGVRRRVALLLLASLALHVATLALALLLCFILIGAMLSSRSWRSGDDGELQGRTVLMLTGGVALVALQVRECYSVPIDSRYLSWLFKGEGKKEEGKCVCERMLSKSMTSTCCKIVKLYYKKIGDGNSLSLFCKTRKLPCNVSRANLVREGKSNLLWSEYSMGLLCKTIRRAVVRRMIN